MQLYSPQHLRKLIPWEPSSGVVFQIYSWTRLRKQTSPSLCVCVCVLSRTLCLSITLDCADQSVDSCHGLFFFSSFPLFYHFCSYNWSCSLSRILFTSPTAERWAVKKPERITWVSRINVFKKKKTKKRKEKKRKTHQKRIDVSRGQTYGGIGFGCSISTGISQSFHLTNRRPEIRSARSSQPQNSEKEPFHCMSAGTDFIYQLFGRGLFWKGAVRYRLYYCWSAAEPYSVYTRDPPPPPLRLARSLAAAAAAPRSRGPNGRSLLWLDAGQVGGARGRLRGTHTHKQNLPGHQYVSI